MQSAVPGHENDDWRHAEHTYISLYAIKTVTGLQHIYRKQTGNQSTDTSCKVQKTPGPPERMNQPTRGRLKRFNFLQHSRIIERRNPELLDHMPKPISSVKTNPSWKQQLPRMCTIVPGVVDRGCQSEPERKSLTQEYVNTKYPEDQWTMPTVMGLQQKPPKIGRWGVHQVQ